MRPISKADHPHPPIASQTSQLCPIDFAPTVMIGEE